MEHRLFLSLIFLYTSFILLISLFIYNLGNFYIFFRKISGKVIIWSLFILCSVLVLNIYIVPHVNHVYFDEFYFMNVAENMHKHNAFAATVYGGTDNPEFLIQPHRLGGYSFLLNIGFKLFGVSQGLAFNINAILGALSVFLIFWVGYLLSDKKILVGLFSATVLFSLPPFLKYSGSHASDISSLFFILATILTCLIYLRMKKPTLLYLAGILGIFSTFIRTENLALCILVLFLAFRQYRQGYFNKIKLILVLSVTLLLLAPFFAGLKHIISVEEVNAAGSFISSAYFFDNFLFNLFYLFDFRFFSLAATIFFLTGSLFLAFEQKKDAIFFISWFLAFFCLYTSHFEGRFSLLFTADYDRHFFPAAIPFCILAGYGIYFILQKIPARKPLYIFLILSTLVVNSYSASAKIIRHTFDRDEYKDCVFIKESSGEFPDGLCILCYEPCHMIVLSGKKAAKVHYFMALNEFPQKVILFKGFQWFRHRQRSRQLENELKKTYGFSIIKEKWINDNQKYGFYLLSRK